ncbi:MAG: hypothetical protein ABSA46_18305 [Thermodesulfovibrionales bacterium]|jgi:hypothetical protein
MRKRRQSKFRGNDIEVKHIDSAAFFDELKRRVYTTATATFAGGEDVLKFDIHKNESGTLVFGYSWEESDILHTRLHRFLVEYIGVGLILSSFTERMQSGLPIRELRGYSVRLGENNIVLFKKQSKAELFAACNTDFTTGEPLTPEIAVEYCDDSLSEEPELG